MAINYPSFRQKGNPTSADRLMICDRCQQASWHVYGWPPVAYCYKVDSTSNKSYGRLREATKEEYAAGIAASQITV